MIRNRSMPARHSMNHPSAHALVKALLALTLVLTSGCGHEEPDKGRTGAGRGKQGIRVAILVDSAVNPMRNYQSTLLEKLIRSRPRMEVSAVHAGGDAGVQARQVRDAARNGADFLMIFPQDPGKLAPILREVMAGGVRVFAFSADIPDDACTCAIFADERRLGQTAGNYIVSALKTKAQAEGRPEPVGRVVLLRGDEDGVASAKRAEGLLDALKTAPGVVLVHDAPANWNETDAAARIQEALRLQKQFDVIYAHNDIIATGASKAVRASSVEARESMLILGTDGVPGKGAGIEMVIRGDQDATVCNPPLVDVAWREVETMLDNPAHTPKKRREVKPFIITLENAPQIQQRGLPRPDTE